MADLRDLLESLGLEDVRTYIASGNVIFRSESAPAAEAIADAIEVRHGFRPDVHLLDPGHLEDAVASNPFPEAEAEPKSLHLYFLRSVPEDPNVDALEALRAPLERFHLAGRVLYLHAPDGIGRSKLAARAERILGVSATARNWRTVERLRAMVDDA